MRKREKRANIREEGRRDREKRRGGWEKGNARKAGEEKKEAEV